MKLALYILFEYIVDPLIDKLNGRDIKAELARHRAEFYRLHEYD